MCSTAAALMPPLVRSMVIPPKISMPDITLRTRDA